MELCQVCNGANSNAFSQGHCHVCGGLCEKGLALAAEAARLMGKEAGAESFCISTSMPREWLAREEAVWDRRLGEKSESVKNALNRRIVAILREGSGLPYDSSDGDCRAVFDFSGTQPSMRVERSALFIFGRYKKHVAGLSQSRWLCSRCEGKGCDSCKGKGKNYESVEERIGEPAKAACGAEGYVMHASGREDVDATNSAGRGFVLEITGPKNRKPDLEELANAVGRSREVSVHGLRFVRRADVELVTESHFDKTYEAEVEFGRDVDADSEKADSSLVRSIEGKTILQQTPARVAHRRADLVRRRKVKHMEPVGFSGRKGTMLIKAEAGTYIKELISGDGGRTRPSVAEVLNTSAVCTKLAVVDIDDGFLDMCLGEKKG